MTWEEAELNLRENVLLNTHLDKRCSYKVVVSVPPSFCNRMKQEGFRIQVGEKSIIDVPFNMLKTLFDASVSNNRIYNNSTFLTLFARKLINKPCYVHSVGKLLEYAGVAIQINKREYRIL